MMYGSKTDNLILLSKKGFNVPEFTVISFEEAFCGARELSLFIDESKSKEITINKLKEYINENIQRHFDVNICGDNFAVRSSCSIEDGENDSFAGQFDTYLNVKRDELDEKIISCFYSMCNENVIDYIVKKKIDIKQMKMNVIVQKMVNSQLSGIIFSSNPQGILNESVIVVGKGLGENVVADKVDSTSYYYNLTDSVYYYEGKENLLDKNTVEMLIELSKSICSAFYDFSDIEFAIENGEIYVLQTRKITTLSSENALILDNSNIVESYPGVSLPLTVSFVNYVYTKVFKGVTKRILKNKNELFKLENTFKNMVGASNGRVYYKISNWYKIIKYLPFSKKIIPVWQEMLGVKNKSYDTFDIGVPFHVKLSVYFHFLKELFLTPKKMKKLKKSFDTVFDFFYQNIELCKNEEEIIKLFDEIERKLILKWDITLINDMYTFIFTGILKSRLKKKYKNFEEKANDLISSLTNVESMKPVKEMVKLAYEKNSLSKDEYEKRFEKYIHLYGDRNVEELKLESATFRTDNSLLEKKIDEYCSDKDKIIQMYRSLNPEKPQDEIREDFLTRFLIKKCTVGIQNREISRLDRSRIYGMVRQMYRKIGIFFEEQKIIDNREDIFYLTMEEIRNCVANKKNMSNTVFKRKQEYELFYSLPSYSRLVFEKKEFDKHHVSVNKNVFYLNDDVLHGTVCSSGHVKGKAVVIEDVSKDIDVKDKIIITKMTDPGWVFLLVAAKGIISEKGSLLSHTAIISRELKIPAIVGVENLLETIKTGDEIEMDASNGTITILKRVGKLESCKI